MTRGVLAGIIPVNSPRVVGRPPRTLTDTGRLRSVLDTVRAQGYAVIDQEREQGVRSVAAPVRDASGQVVAALNISANAGRTTLRELREHFTPLIVRTAAAVSADLGWR